MSLWKEYETDEKLGAYLNTLGVEELSELTARMEFDAFDEVKNEGGRASCQDDWNTFSIMRRSQYNTWTSEMLVRYILDFAGRMRSGSNPITEKYARMEESTAPEKWREIKDSFPVIDEESKAVIEAIVQLQVGWMEDFAVEYPHLASNARSIHTSEDSEYNTSYETYLRGELSTYSGEMLAMYGAFVAKIGKEGYNLARMIMTQTVKLYGYESLESAEKALDVAERNG